MNQLDLPARAPDPSVGALSVDAKWVADKLSEYGFKMDDLEALYPAAEAIARNGPPAATSSSQSTSSRARCAAGSG